MIKKKKGGNKIWKSEALRTGVILGEIDPIPLLVSDGRKSEETGMEEWGWNDPGHPSSSKRPQFNPLFIWEFNRPWRQSLVHERARDFLSKTEDVDRIINSETFASLYFLSSCIQIKITFNWSPTIVSLLSFIMLLLFPFPIYNIAWKFDYGKIN